MKTAEQSCPQGESLKPTRLATQRSKKLLVIVGSPNVGKSVLFNNLTGAYATVSNYPGTTVEVARGRARIGHEEWEVVDTPGMYSLLPNTEEERVARTILFTESPEVVLHVVDAKNLQRMLPLTLQLLEAGLPIVLVLNIMDEAEKRGIEVEVPRLRQELNVPVVPTISTSGWGVEDLKEEVLRSQPAERREPVTYNEPIEDALARISEFLNGSGGFEPRALGLLLLQGDGEAKSLLQGEAAAQVEAVIQECVDRHSQPLTYLIAAQRHLRASQIAEAALKVPSDRQQSFSERLSSLLINPWTGVPILFAVLYYGLFRFVGGLGAGVAVDFLESKVFDGHINPFVESLCQRFVPWGVIRELLAGEYGVVTLGLRYAVAIVLPIVAFFFLVFSLMEDTGYLPRLAMLIDRVFKQIGLSGRGVIPLVLGLGCDTMATMVTRTLPTVRERVIATLLLALAVPCSAQLGVILALLHGRPLAFAVWSGVVGTTFLLTGFLASRLMPGERPHFFMELPPLRLPKLSNVCMKTYTRLHWYLKEVLPLFLFASLLIWLGQLTGLFDLLVAALSSPVRWIGLPPEAAKVFLFGFFRRDYGAAGLYDLSKTHVLSGVQLTVATIALTLFLPCIAQFLINLKERGAKAGFAISGFILFFSFAVAFLANFVLHRLGATL